VRRPASHPLNTDRKQSKQPFADTRTERKKVVERNEKGEARRVVGTHTNITAEQKNLSKHCKDSELRLSLVTAEA
jgi:hypothetical protein